MRKNVAITGAAGYLARCIASELSKEPEIERILGIDIRILQQSAEKFTQVRMDIRDDGLAEIMREHEIDTVLHFAWMVKPTRNRKLMHDVDVNGTKNVLRCCVQAQVEHVVIPSSTTAYGAHPDNPDRLTEDMPLRPNTGISYAEDKCEVENFCEKFEAEHENMIMTRLRVCTVGGSGVHDFIRDSFTRWGVMIKGHDPEMQFIHEYDVARLMHAVVMRQPAGVFNVTSDDALKISEIPRILHKHPRVYPEAFLTRLVEAAWLLRLSPQSAPYLQLIKHRWVASNEKVKEKLQFTLRYSSEEALEAMISTAQEGH